MEGSLKIAPLNFRYGINRNRGYVYNGFGQSFPTIISDDHNLIITFYALDECVSDELIQSSTAYDVGVYTIKFKEFSKYTFGFPNDEAIHGHPYYKLGMMPYSFYELKNSDWIRALENIDKVHPRYKHDKWKADKHYIITFHDNMFECVAKGFEVSKETRPLHDHVR